MLVEIMFADLRARVVRVSWCIRMCCTCSVAVSTYVNSHDNLYVVSVYVLLVLGVLFQQHALLMSQATLKSVREQGMARTLGDAVEDSGQR